MALIGEYVIDKHSPVDMMERKKMEEVGECGILVSSVL